MPIPRHPARLIPVSGIASSEEAEQRAASALLAVLTAVRDLSSALLSPLGAPKAQRATVEAFTEGVFDHEGRKVRPDGLLTVSYGNRVWNALVEVKTGPDLLDADQCNLYWEIARREGYDCLLTISNEIVPAPGLHPTTGLKVTKASRVKVGHLSWTAILTTARRIREHTPIDDQDQAWILNELIRYLEHPASGASSFKDMGPHWASIRDAARTSALTKKTEGLDDVVARWDQLIRFASLRLASEIGEDVEVVFPRGQHDLKARQAYLASRLASAGVLDAALRIPKTAGDLAVEADLRAGQLLACVGFGAPQDRGARGRVSWLVNQIKDAPGGLVIEAYPKNKKTPIVTSLAAAIEDRNALLGAERQEPHRFRLLIRAGMGAGRKAGKGERSFVDSVLNLIADFYEAVIQEIEDWRPLAPKLRRPAGEDQEIIEAEVEETPGLPPGPVAGLAEDQP